LRDIVQQHLLQDVFEASNAVIQLSQQQQNLQGGGGGVSSSWMVLVVDPESLRVISSSIGMYNLMEHHVSIVEDLLKKRAPFRDQAVLYLVEPNEVSVAKIIEDWTPSSNKKGGGSSSGPLYGNTVFLYFLGHLPDNLFTQIKNCKELVRRIKVLKEVNIDFLIKESRAFHFDMGKSSPIYTSLYTSSSSSVSSTMNLFHHRMISKLVTVCATMNEYPHVRFHHKNELCKQLSFLFQQKMNEFVGSNDSWWYHGDGLHPNTSRATLLLLDRKEDCLSPLMHEFTYEAMVNDLLSIEDDRITYESVNAGTAKEGTTQETTTKMDALLNENDEVWVELRGKHIADVIQTLSTKIRDIVNSSSGSALGSSAKGNGKALSINQMAKALKALPEYREIMSKLSQHMQIAHQCMDAFNQQKLLELSDLEQTLATGKTDEGRNPKLKELLGQVVEYFRKQPNSYMRWRLLAIVIVSQRGVSSASDLQKLLQEANLSREELSTLHNLEKMGCPLVRNNDGNNKSASSKFANLREVRVSSFGGNGAVESTSEYSSSRYVCLLKSILEDAASGTLSVEEYPSVMPLPDAEAVLGGSAIGSALSVRKKTESGNWKTDKGKKKAHGGRQIVFMVGGMCYSEMRSAREVMNATGKEIIIGSTRCIAPKDFAKDLYSLG
jgi:syntaxin-binding protein 1